MNPTLVSAVFDSHADAEHAVGELRAAGVADQAISLIAHHDENVVPTEGADAAETTDFVGKVAAGAGVGTLIGIAALAIPGVGPLVAAGAIAATAIPGAAITGAAIGGAAGGLAKVLGDHGVDDRDAGYFEHRVNDGGVFVSVDTSSEDPSTDTVTNILNRTGGHSANRPKLVATM